MASSGPDVSMPPNRDSSLPAAAAQCCKGPAKGNSEACCARDEEAKATGSQGCGCQSSEAAPVVKTSCCAGMATELPNIVQEHFQIPDLSRLQPREMQHAPRILILYGSTRQRSFSRFLAEEAGRLLVAFGAEVRFFNPSGLPLPDDAPDAHPKVQELRQLTSWCEGMLWSSPERHGAMSGIMKAQIDWIPLNTGAVRPTQGKTLAVMQVSGGSQSFNAVNQMRVLGRWMRMITIPNQSSVPKAFQEFDEHGRMKPSALYERVVDVTEELMKFTLLTRGVSSYLVDRYSERKESAADLAKRVRLNQAVTGVGR